MKMRTLKFLAGLCFTFAASNVSADVKVTIEQEPPEPVNYDSAINSCSDTWNRLTEDDHEFEDVIISRFGSKGAYLRKCANEFVENEERKRQFPVKEVYCELDAYQKIIEDHYDKLEGNYIDWKMFRALTVMYSASSICMNEDIPR